MTSEPSLRRRREALGLSLEAVAEATAIPLDYLVAVEAGHAHELPPGPYAQAYAEALARHLDRAERRDATAPPLGLQHAMERPTGPVPTPDGGERTALPPRVTSRPVPVPEDGSRRLPLGLVRVLAWGMTASFVALLGVQAWTVWQVRRPVLPPPVVQPIEVSFEMRANGVVRVEVDGRVVDDRLFVGGEQAHFVATERVAVVVPNLDAARVRFQGRVVSPRGRQDRPRRLVFVNDQEAR